MSSHPENPIPTRDTVLVVGAGPAGLAAGAALQAAGVPFLIVDPGQDVGGIWNGEAQSPVWQAMAPITSRDLTQFEDLLMPASFPAFPSAEQLTKYLRAYAARHDLTEHFRPGVTVRTAVPFDENVWQVELSTGEISVYRALIVATGTSSVPHLPTWARGVADRELGREVRVVHARDWNGAQGLEGRRVLVVGSGQSAADIAVDAATRALEVRWSIRTGHWVVPRSIAGTPGDVAVAREPALLGPLNARIAETVVRRTVGAPEKVGLPAPQAPLLEDRVIVSDDVLSRIQEGRVRPAADVSALEDDGAVRLVDGSRLEPDVIVLATGYQEGAQFLPADLLPTSGAGTRDLFLGAFPRGRDDLVLLGQVRVAGSPWPLLAQQARIAARFLRAVRDGDPGAEAFRRLRRGSDDAVPAHAPRADGRPEEGLRGRLAEGLERIQDLSRRQATPRRVLEPGQLPFVDRGDLAARLRAVETVLGEDSAADRLPAPPR
ncbi:flavin-containing monooxygenase [Brachybacterium sp. AOP25-B2-12]|uniref:flavin-containing monooxygenase n=1 Tax=Brachybacterium sp. AOP25-B2-12 TaxID=3457710 RepID=UPI0040334944